MPLKTNKNQESVIDIGEFEPSTTYAEDDIKIYENLIRRFKNINTNIKFVIESINNNLNTSDPTEIKQVNLKLNYLENLYKVMPSFKQPEKDEKLEKWGWKTFSTVSALLLFGLGVAARTAQRAFSTDVVTFNLQNDTLLRQSEELAVGMWESLQKPQNHGLAAIDVVFSFTASLFPFAVKDLLNLFTNEKNAKSVNLNNFVPLEIIIQFLEKCLESQNYQALALYKTEMNNLCHELEIESQNHQVWDIDDEKFNSEDRIKTLNELTKTDLKKQNYSVKTVAKNSVSNVSAWLKSNAISHSVITLSSSYTARTLNSLEHYTKMLINPTNIVSTFTRATVMNLVNQHLIKNSLEKLINVSLLCCSSDKKNISLQEVKKNINQSIKKRSKTSQAAIVITSFLFITFISNWIKTFAADLTQNEGNFSKAIDQMNETFWSLAMVGIATLVTSSDMLILQLKMKDVLKLKMENQKQKKMIDQIFAKNLIKPQEYDKRASEFFLNQADLDQNRAKLFEGKDFLSSITTLETNPFFQTQAEIHPSPIIGQNFPYLANQNSEISNFEVNDYQGIDEVDSIAHQ